MKAIIRQINYQVGFLYVETVLNTKSKFKTLSDDNFEN